MAFNRESDVALTTKWQSTVSTAVFIKPLAKYFLQNHQRFLDHIRNMHDSDIIMPDELVFVTGTVTTGDWVMARASGTGSEEFHIGFNCGYTGIGGAHVHWNHLSDSTSSLPHREGPQRPPGFDYSTTPQFNQCIFLKRLRLFARSAMSRLRQRIFLTAAGSVKGDLQQLLIQKDVVDDNEQSTLGALVSIMLYSCTPLVNLTTYQITGVPTHKTNSLVVYIFEVSESST